MKCLQSFPKIRIIFTSERWTGFPGIFSKFSKIFFKFQFRIKNFWFAAHRRQIFAQINVNFIVSLIRSNIKLIKDFCFKGHAATLLSGVAVCLLILKNRLYQCMFDDRRRRAEKEECEIFLGMIK